MAALRVLHGGRARRGRSLDITLTLALLLLALGVYFGVLYGVYQLLSWYQS